jgi:hypothetical protein
LGALNEITSPIVPVDDPDFALSGKNLFCVCLRSFFQGYAANAAGSLPKRNSVASAHLRCRPYMATTMRFGLEWLLTPLLVYQNYHLIHHLYPEIPFYRMHKAYYLRYDEINAQDIPRQTAFGLAPENIESHRAFRRMKDAIAVPAE